MPQFAIPLRLATNTYFALAQHNDVTRRIAAMTGTAQFDLAAVFPDDSSLFTDGRHLTKAGNRIKRAIDRRLHHGPILVVIHNEAAKPGFIAWDATRCRTSSPARSGTAALFLCGRFGRRREAPSCISRRLRSVKRDRSCVRTAGAQIGQPVNRDIVVYVGRLNGRKAGFPSNSGLERFR